MRATNASLVAVLLHCIPAFHPVAGAQALSSIVVSAARAPLAGSEVGSALSVLTAEELEARQIRFVSDALRAVPGLAVNRSGPAGQLTQVRMRGAEANHTVVLIDGMKINDPFSSEVDFAHLLAAHIERIEILRGPQSVLYGSEAIGGVISIITRRASEGVQSEASVEAGSFSSASGAAALRGATERIDYALSLQNFRTSGTNVSRLGSEDDGYRNRSLHASLRFAPSGNLTLDASLRTREGRSMTDPQDFSFPPGPYYGMVIDGDRRTDSSQLDARVRAQMRGMEGRLEQQLGVAQSRSASDLFDDRVLAASSEGERLLFDYLGSLRIGQGAAPQVVTLALHSERLRFVNRGSAQDPAQTQTRHNARTGLALEYRVRLPAQTALTLSARRDHHQLFGDANTYRITAAQPIGAVKLRASTGTGVANPTFFELFGFIPNSFDPNPALKPEKSRGSDLGVDLDLLGGAGSLSISIFTADLRNEITGSFNPSTFRSTSVNLQGSSQRSGIEVATRWQINDLWSLAAAYTHTDSKQPDGEAEVRRPRHLASASAQYMLPARKAGLSMAVEHNGRQEDLDFRGLGSARVMLRSYTLLRFAARYPLAPQVDLTARIENALDQRYEEVFSYRASGRAFFLGLAARL